jgi:predicted dehydrogenase
MTGTADFNQGVCVWGSGPWAGFTLASLTDLGVTALYVGGDPAGEKRIERLRKLARVYDAKVFHDPGQVATFGCEAVILALPPDQNLSHGKLFLQAGLDVYVQKPLAPTLREAQALFDVARRENRILMGGSDFCYRPDIVRAKELIRQGYIGKATYLHAQFCRIQKPQSWRQDVFEDMGEHAISAITELMGTPRTLAIKRQGTLSGQIYMEGESWSADARLSWETFRGEVPEIIVEGTEGSFHLNMRDWRTVHYYRTVTSSGPLWRKPEFHSHHVIHCDGIHSYARKLAEFLNASKNRTGVTNFSAELQKFRMLREAMEAAPQPELRQP